jgi:hypothetical protein
MLPPVPRCSGWAYSSLISPNRISLPRFGGRVSLHIDLFEACSAFTRVAACTLARSPIVTANRRLQPFRYLHDCSDCFRLERIAGWASHPLESAAFSRRTPIPAVRANTIEWLKSTLTGRSLQATATGRNAPEPSSSRARRPTVFVGSCRSLARFGCQRCAKRDVTGHIIMADGSYRTV